MSVPGNVTFRINANPVLDRLLLRSNALKKRVGIGAMRVALQPMLQEARARVPKDTGSLRRGLVRTAKAYANGLRIVGLVGPSRSTHKTIQQGRKRTIVPSPYGGSIRVTRYAHMVENGTVKMAARPFLRPAFDHGMLRFPADFGRALMSIISAVSP